MAVAHATSSQTAAYTSTGSQTTSHAGSASAKAAVVLIHQQGSADEVSGVTYGGVDMVEAGTNSETTEAGRVYIYYLLNPPQGTQNVVITTTAGASKVASINTMTCAAGYEIRVAGAGYATGTSSSIANPAWNITGLTSGENVQAYEVVHSGLQSMTTTPQASPAWTLITSNDLGAVGNGWARINNTPAGTTLACGWAAATADDFVGASIAFRETLVVGDTFQIIYKTIDAINNEIELQYNVETTIDNSIELQYNTAVFAGDTVELQYKTLVVSSHNEPFSYASSGSVTTGNSTGDDIGGSVTYTASPGGRAGTCAILSGVSRFGFTTDISAPITSGPLYLRAYVRLGATDPSYQKLLMAEDHQGAYIGNGWDFDSTGLGLRLYSLTSNSGTSYTYALDTWYRLEVDINYTSKTVTGRIYLGDSTTPVSTQSTSWTTIARTNVNGQADGAWVRRNSTGVVYLDDFAWSTTNQPGPTAEMGSNTAVGDTSSLIWNVLHVTNGASTGVTRYFGVNSHPVWETTTGHSVEFNYLDAAECKAVRIDVRWDLIEETEGSRSGGYLDRIDNYMTQAASRNIKVLPIITGAPTWAADATGGNGTPPNAAHYSSYASFCAWAANRWQSACDAIEIWNEPNFGDFWTGNGGGGCLGDYSGSPYPRTPNKYSDLLAAAYDAIKTAVPSMLVVGSGGFTAQNEDWRMSIHFDNLTNNGSFAHMDVLSIHIYPDHITQIYPELTSPNQPWYNSSNKNASMIGMVETDVLSLLTAAGYGNMPVWVTETGYTTTGTGGNNCTEAQQVTKVGELATAFADQPWPTTIERIYWFSLFDGKASEDTIAEKNWGLINLTNEDYANLTGTSPKSSWSTFASATKILVGEGGISQLSLLWNAHAVAGDSCQIIYNVLENLATTQIGKNSSLLYNIRSLSTDSAVLVHNTRYALFDSCQFIYKTRAVQTGTSQRQLIYRTRANAGDVSQIVYNSRTLAYDAAQIVYNMRSLATDSSVLRHNTRTMTFNSSVLRYNTRTMTFDSSQIIYKTWTLAGDTSQLVYKTRAVSGDISQLVYKTQALAGDTSQLIYKTRALAGDPIQLIYSVRLVQTGVSQLQLIHRTRALAGDNSQIIHKTLAVAGDNSVIVYNVLNLNLSVLGKNSQIVYKTRAVAFDSLQLVYRVSYILGDSSQLIHRTRALASDSEQIRYNTRTSSYDSVQFIYKTRVVQTGTSQRQILHNTRALVFDSSQIIHKTRITSSDSLTMIYRTRVSAGSDSEIIYNVTVNVGASEQIVHNTLIYAGLSIILLYKVLSLSINNGYPVKIQLNGVFVEARLWVKANGDWKTPLIHAL